MTIDWQKVSKIYELWKSVKVVAIYDITFENREGKTFKNPTMKKFILFDEKSKTGTRYVTVKVFIDHSADMMRIAEFGKNNERVEVKKEEIR
jgi:hypothetical protein